MGLNVLGHNITQPTLNYFLQNKRSNNRKRLVEVTGCSEEVVNEVIRLIDEEDLRVVPELHQFIYGGKKQQKREATMSQNSSTKDSVLKVLAGASTQMLPGTVVKQTKKPDPDVKSILKALKRDGLALYKSCGHYTISEKGISLAKSKGFEVHSSTSARIDNFLKSQIEKGEPLTPKVAKVKPSAIAQQPSEDSDTPMDELFGTIELSLRGSKLLFQLVQSLNEGHLVNAGFSPKDIEDFSGVYHTIKYQAQGAL
ncbi:hypothetical protein [Alteromonas sp. KUL49]|uniref:hypothetical protein n=1 Tax=Alteromonas sp. KUL49 TaxID=2480798 RepID=UPI00102F2AD8|nr:hypothetical protein [Alteromonas sp. KUL49]TAP38758.1 hypothetical protein EYS00_15255 [Alteromonas sp. KUL49]GEA12713.1 hypothetical protein KUL49_30880 [Alteromonas sp. KUL49]